MPELCPRCEAVLPWMDGSPAAFCPHCGLPQLRVSETILEAASGTGLASGSIEAVGGTTVVSTGAGDGLDWPRVLRIVLVAAVAGLLPCVVMRDVLFSGAAAVPALLLMPMLCLASAFVYVRWRPLSAMTAGKGAQMGLALGSLLALLVVTVTAVASFALRYGKHVRSLQQNFDVVMQQAEAQVRANQMNAPENLLQAMHSPEWHAGWFLVMQGAFMVLLVITGAVAGLVAGALLSARQRTLRAGL